MYKFLPYILKNIRRNKVRTTLTVVGVMVAVSIFVFLGSFESSINATVESASQQTLLVMSQKDAW
jgi:cell division protein FtsX